MHVAKLTLLCAALVPTVAFGGSRLKNGPTPDSTSGVQLEVNAVTITAEGLPVGCAINAKAWNKGRRKAAISRDSQVKSANFGTWKKLRQVRVDQPWTDGQLDLQAGLSLLGEEEIPFSHQAV